MMEVCPMADGREPVALAMILCDGIHVDPDNGKRTLLGLFSVVYSPTTPVQMSNFAVYVALTECRGKVPLMLRIYDVDEDREPVVLVEAEFESDDPIGVTEISLNLGRVVFPEYGEYRVTLFSAGTPVIERRMVIMNAPEHPKQDPSRDHPNPEL
jgi:hypothetical protein